MLAVSALWHTIYQTAFHLSSPPQHHKLCRKVDSVHGRKTRLIKVSMVLSVAPLFWIRKRIQLLTRFRAVKLTRTVGMFMAQFLQHNIHQNVCKWKYPKIKKSSFVSKKKIIIPDFDLENSKNKSVLSFRVIPYLESSIKKPDANQFSHSAGQELKQLVILHPYVPAVGWCTLGQARHRSQ